MQQSNSEFKLKSSNQSYVVDCAKLFSGDAVEIEHAKRIPFHDTDDQALDNDIEQGCESFRRKHKLSETSATSKNSLSIAFSVLVYRDAAQVWK